MTSLNDDRGTLEHAADIAFALARTMDAARQDDADLMTEIQSFLIEPASHIPLLGKDKMSRIAVAVLRWLQVRSIFSPVNPLKLVPNNRLPVCRSLMTHQTK